MSILIVKAIHLEYKYLQPFTHVNLCTPFCNYEFPLILKDLINIFICRKKSPCPLMQIFKVCKAVNRLLSKFHSLSLNYFVKSQKPYQENELRKHSYLNPKSNLISNVFTVMCCISFCITLPSFFPLFLNIEYMKNKY